MNILNLKDLGAKRKLMQYIGSLPGGLYEVLIKPRRLTRTLDQNAYYFAAVVTPWMEWLREQYGDPTINSEQAHYALVGAVLGKKAVVNEEMGVTVELLPRTSIMTTEEFSDYIEAAAKFLAEFAEIVVVSSEFYTEAGAK